MEECTPAEKPPGTGLIDEAKAPAIDDDAPAVSQS